MDNRVKYGTSFTQNKMYGKNGFKLDNRFIYIPKYLDACLWKIGSFFQTILNLVVLKCVMRFPAHLLYLSY